MNEQRVTLVAIDDDPATLELITGSGKYGAADGKIDPEASNCGDKQRRPKPENRGGDNDRSQQRSVMVFQTKNGL
jgi:hypothetical protein